MLPSFPGRDMLTDRHSGDTAYCVLYLSPAILFPASYLKKSKLSSHFPFHSFCFPILRKHDISNITTGVNTSVSAAGKSLAT